MPIIPNVCCAPIRKRAYWPIPRCRPTYIKFLLFYTSEIHIANFVDYFRNLCPPSIGALRSSGSRLEGLSLMSTLQLTLYGKCKSWRSSPAGGTSAISYSNRATLSGSEYIGRKIEWVWIDSPWGSRCASEKCIQAWVMYSHILAFMLTSNALNQAVCLFIAAIVCKLHNVVGGLPDNTSFKYVSHYQTHYPNRDLPADRNGRTGRSRLRVPSKE